MRIAIALLSLGLTACVCPWSGQNCGLDGRMPPPRGGLDDTFPNVSPPSARQHIVQTRDRLLSELRTVLTAVAPAQERVRAREGGYTSDVQQLLGEIDGAVEISASIALNVQNATDSTWAASAVHAGLGTHSCVISVGPKRGAPRIHTLRQRLSGHLAPGVVTCDVP
jgi:hypothetical protein